MAKKNTRQGLEALPEERWRFRGFFVRYGHKNAYRGLPITTFLLCDVCLAENGEQVTDHLWFTETKGFKAVGFLNEGDCLEFDARVGTYRKGYQGHREAVYKPAYRDWRLSYPTKIQRNHALDRKPSIVVLELTKRKGRIQVKLTKAIFPSGFRPQDSLTKEFWPMIDGKRRAVHAAALVAQWAREPERTEEEIVLARGFLARWPNGPQI